MCTCVFGALMGHKMTSDPLGLELFTTPWVLGVKLMSSWKSRESSWLLSHLSSLFIEGLSLAENLPSWLNCLFRKPQAPTCHSTPSTPPQCFRADFSCKFWGTKLRLRVCTTRALKSDPSPLPISTIFDSPLARMSHMDLENAEEDKGLFSL